MPVDVDAAVLANNRLSPEYNVVVLAAPEIARRAEPGQFVMVKPTPGCDPLLRRPFSIFEIVRDEDGQPVGISLLNRRVGVGTSLILDLRPDDRLSCLGPLGRPFVPVDPPARAWLVAGGVGLAPFATLAEALAARGTETTLFYGGHSARDLFCVDFFERLGARVILSTEDGTRGERGFITRPLERALRDAPAADPIVLYACGPTAMMRTVARLASAHGRHAFVSLEQVMGCGLGGCYSCVVAVRGENGAGHYVRSCVEGPVFTSDQVLWDQLTGH